MRGKRFDTSDIYRELTPMGTGLCIMLGLLLEITIFLVVGIQVRQVPVIVLVFMWFLCGMMASGILILSAALRDRIAPGQADTPDGSGQLRIRGTISDEELYVEEIPVAC
ncbi:MAG: hypothetical protein LUI13_12040 [Lachnospiraceae bacterium]|nr:hypothetical protein [Lachnospiraceae bacterium]